MLNLLFLIYYHIYNLYIILLHIIIYIFYIFLLQVNVWCPIIIDYDYRILIWYLLVLVLLIWGWKKDFLKLFIIMVVHQRGMSVVNLCYRVQKGFLLTFRLRGMVVWFGTIWLLWSIHSIIIISKLTYMIDVREVIYSMINATDHAKI